MKINRCIGLMLILLLLTACQPTPSTAAVVGKNEGLLEEAMENPGSETNALSMPEHISEELINNVLFIDADVRLPQTSRFPVFSVEPSAFTDEIATRVKSFFFGDAKLVNTDIQLTKTEIEELIIEAKKTVSDPNSEPDDIETAKAYIAQLETAYTAAPETRKVENVESVHLAPYADAPNLLGFEACADLGYSELSAFDVSNNSDPQRSMLNVRIDPETLRSLGDTYEPAAEDEDAATSAMIEAAMASVDEILRGIQVDYMAVAQTEKMLDANGKVVGLKMKLTRTAVDGMQISAGRLIDRAPAAQYDAKWAGETMNIWFNNEKPMGFTWENIAEVKETRSESAKLLSADEVLTIIRQQLKNSFAYLEGTTGQSTTINKIALEYSYLKEKNSSGSYLLAPTWNCYGNTIVPNAGLGEDYKLYGSSDAILLCINALDGSVIK